MGNSFLKNLPGGEAPPRTQQTSTVKPTKPDAAPVPVAPKTPAPTGEKLNSIWVQELQGMLNGYYGNIPVNGVYDDFTNRALIQFLRETPTFVNPADREAWAALRKMYGRKISGDFKETGTPHVLREIFEILQARGPIQATSPQEKELRSLNIRFTNGGKGTPVEVVFPIRYAMRLNVGYLDKAIKDFVLNAYYRANSIPIPESYGAYDGMFQAISEVQAEISRALQEYPGFADNLSLQHAHDNVMARFTELSSTYSGKKDYMQTAGALDRIHKDFATIYDYAKNDSTLKQKMDSRAIYFLFGSTVRAVDKDGNITRPQAYEAARVELGRLLWDTVRGHFGSNMPTIKPTAPVRPPMPAKHNPASPLFPTTPAYNVPPPQSPSSKDLIVPNFSET